MLNLFAVGLHHLVEQQQLSFLRRELVPWGEELDPSQVRVSEFKRRLRKSSIDIASYPCWTKMTELKLVANAVKHAEGDSAERLRSARPDIFTEPSIRHKQELVEWGPTRRLFSPLSGDDLYVAESDIGAYFNAAEDFWKALASDLRILARD